MQVLAEVKDKQARHVLATLPFELRVRDPDEDAVRAVRRFARLTGDLGALSEPDIKVRAPCAATRAPRAARRAPPLSARAA
jgi:RNA-binding protein NOB1